MLIIYVDHPTTKRRTITLIMDEKGVLIWSGPGFNEAIAWLIEAEESEIWIGIDEKYRRMSLGPLLDTPLEPGYPVLPPHGISLDFS